MLIIYIQFFEAESCFKLFPCLLVHFSHLFYCSPKVIPLRISLSYPSVNLKLLLVNYCSLYVCVYQANIIELLLEMLLIN